MSNPQGIIKTVIQCLVTFAFVTLASLLGAVQSPDVYVAGYEESAQGKRIAVLWKNGAVQRLSDGSQNSDAYSIYSGSI